MIFYTSDLHFGHKNVIGFDNRPFSDVEEMDCTLIELWNGRVTDDDDVYIVGDFAYRNEKPASWYLERLKGRKHLVIGNHDQLTLEEPTAMTHFESVEKMMHIVDNGYHICLCHFPVAEWNGYFKGHYHIYGHIHNRIDAAYYFMSSLNGKALNAGCMINGFMPQTFDGIVRNNNEFNEKHRACSEE
ncbi:MAG: hydrolase [Ruminiclostridium sp.]|nr:hydrolase [Ruminiclostridium sp.]